MKWEKQAISNNKQTTKEPNLNPNNRINSPKVWASLSQLQTNRKRSKSSKPPCPTMIGSKPFLPALPEIQNKARQIWHRIGSQQTWTRIHLIWEVTSNLRDLKTQRKWSIKQKKACNCSRCRVEVRWKRKLAFWILISLNKLKQRAKSQKRLNHQAFVYSAHKMNRCHQSQLPQ